MRDLKSSTKNEFIVFDQISGSKVKLFYKTITTEDRLNYNSEIVRTLSKTKDVKDALKIQIDWSEDLITGFREGDFSVDGKPISSDPDSENYYEGWKGLLKETASDLLLLFSKTILGEPGFVVKDDEPNFFSRNLKDTAADGPKKKKSTTKN